MFISKITLGTAQLGLNYGIANMIGKPNFQSSIEILEYAWNNNITSFDTSPVYGNSEKIIGTFIDSKLKMTREKINIISKLPKLEFNENITFDHLYNYTKDQLKKTLKDLNLDKIPIYLIHHAPDLYFKNGIIIQCLDQLKEEGLIKHIGISVYNPNEVEASINFKEIDVIQIPINIFDQRLITTGLLEKLGKNGYIIFARSIYLKGLFFIQPQNLPNYLKKAEEHLIKLRNISKEYNIEIDKLAFLFVKDLPEITSLVIGAEKIEQVTKNIELLKEKPLSNEIRQKILDEFSDLSEDIINPSYWNKSNKKKNKL